MAAAFRAIATAVPEHRLDAGEAVATLRRFFPRLDRVQPDETALGTRYTCEPVEDLLTPRSLTELGAAYLRHAKRLAIQSACAALAKAGLLGRDIDLVITVSCTGYLVPSIDVHMAREIGLRPDVLRLPITELGCSGGAAAIAAAQRHLAAYPDDHVLVCAVEIPSLSFQREDRTLDHLTACLVFGDGAGAAVIGRADPRADRLEVSRAASHLIPDSEDVLGFDLREGGFHVVLDRRLPRILRRELKPVVDGFMSRPAFYAVHAAGPRIFAEIESTLDLPPGALDLSREVFAAVGNTSSAAIFFVLERLLRAPARGGVGLGLGLGPGLTVELMELTYVSAAPPATRSPARPEESR